LTSSWTGDGAEGGELKLRRGRRADRLSDRHGWLLMGKGGQFFTIRRVTVVLEICDPWVSVVGRFVPHARIFSLPKWVPPDS